MSVFEYPFEAKASLLHVLTVHILAVLDGGKVNRSKVNSNADCVFHMM